ncbi:hypothetical protein BHE74_00028204 [Ensete ventricosum]|nr:hypothetical protein BHE74_00028204 [Ensete ventricosum]
MPRCYRKLAIIGTLLVLRALGPEHQILLVLLLSPPECPTGCERPPRRCRPSISPIPITTSAFGSSPLNLKQSKKKAKKPAPVPILAGHVHHRPLPSRGQPRRPAHSLPRQHVTAPANPFLLVSAAALRPISTLPPSTFTTRSSVCPVSSVAIVAELGLDLTYGRSHGGWGGDPLAAKLYLRLLLDKEAPAAASAAPSLRSSPAAPTASLLRTSPTASTGKKRFHLLLQK